MLVSLGILDISLCKMTILFYWIFLDIYKTHAKIGDDNTIDYEVNDD